MDTRADTTQTERNKAPSTGVKTARAIYIAFAWLFAAGIVLQVFFAGLGVLVSPSYFGWHSTFAHLLEPLLFVMLIVGVIGRVGWGNIGLNLLLFGLFTMQYVFLYAFQGAPRALHLVNALALFWVAIYLGKRSWYVARRMQATAARATGTSSSPTSSSRGGHMSLGRLFVGVALVLLGAAFLFGVIFDNGPGFITLDDADDPPKQQEADLNTASGATELMAGQGAQIFAQNCSSCHGEHGGGGFGPALAGSAALGDSAHVVNQILEGGGGMPAFGNRLSDGEIAAVASFVRSSWGNDYDPVSLEEVEVQR